MQISCAQTPLWSVSLKPQQKEKEKSILLKMFY